MIDFLLNPLFHSLIGRTLDRKMKLLRFLLTRGMLSCESRAEFVLPVGIVLCQNVIFAVSRS